MIFLNLGRWGFKDFFGWLAWNRKRWRVQGDDTEGGHQGIISKRDSKKKKKKKNRTLNFKFIRSNSLNKLIHGGRPKEVSHPIASVSFKVIYFLNISGICSLSQSRIARKA